MTPPGSVLITAYIQRGLAFEAKGDTRAPGRTTLRRWKASGLGCRQQGQSGDGKGADLVLSERPGCTRCPRRHPPTRRRRRRAPQTDSAAGLRRPPRRPPAPAPRRAGDRQRRLCKCQAAAQSIERRALDREKPARHRLHCDRRHRPRPRGDAGDDPRIPARAPRGAGGGGLLRRSPAYRSTAATIWCRSTYSFDPAET